MERRKSVRVSWGAEVEVRIGEGHAVGTIMNILPNGPFVQGSRNDAMARLRLMTAFRDADGLTFSLEGPGAEADMRATGVVAWMSDLGVGLDFREASPALLRFIARLREDPGAGAGVVATIRAGSA